LDGHNFDGLILLQVLATVWHLEIGSIVRGDDAVGVHGGVRGEVMRLDVVDRVVGLDLGDGVHIANESEQVGIVDEALLVGLEVRLNKKEERRKKKGDEREGQSAVSDHKFGAIPCVHRSCWPARSTELTM